LLYSQYSNACLINTEYLNTSEFNRLFDIFSTKRLADSNIIEAQFARIPEQYYNYSAAGLNASNNQIVSAVRSGATNQQGYFIATLEAFNATAKLNTTSSGNGPGGPGHGANGGGGNTNTGLAMIILCAITGLWLP